MVLAAFTINYGAFLPRVNCGTETYLEITYIGEVLSANLRPSFFSTA